MSNSRRCADVRFLDAEMAQTLEAQAIPSVAGYDVRPGFPGL
jgi:hypothetical protein